jgi:hypothetical protein
MSPNMFSATTTSGSLDCRSAWRTRRPTAGPGTVCRARLVHLLCAVSETRSVTSRRAENYVRSAREAIQPGGWYVWTGASGVPALTHRSAFPPDDCRQPERASGEAS